MHIFHFATKTGGFKFLWDIHKVLLQWFPPEYYKRYFSKINFLSELNDKKDSFDMVLITAHGKANAILKFTNGTFAKYILADETTAFKNKFVFAISCATALDFGEQSYANGAMSYLGYMTDIGRILWPEYKSIPNKDLERKLRIIYNRIFVRELCNCLVQFTQNIYTVKEFKQRFAFGIDMRIVELQNMTCMEIRQTYDVDIDDDFFQANRALIIFDYLSEIKEANNHLKLIGDENYFSDGFIDYMLKNGCSKHIIKKHLIDKEAFKNIQKPEYKTYLLNRLR